MLFQEKQKSSQRKIHKSSEKQFIEVPYNNFSTKGYVNVKSASDTIIDGISCKKLVKSIHMYDFMTDKIYERIFGYEYMTQINDSVMIYVDGVFKKLYDFSAEVGDSIIIPALEHHEEYTHGTAVVTGKGVMEFEGDTLKYLDLKQPDDWEDSPWKFSCYHDYSNDYYKTVRICEKIGNISGYLLPEKYFVADYEEGGALLCYSDEELSVKFSDEDCDYIYEPRLYDSFFGNDSTRLNIYHSHIIDALHTFVINISNRDTVNINGTSYYKTTGGDYYYSDLYYREDRETGRLYQYVERNDIYVGELKVEVLICDMSLNVGDTFHFPYELDYYTEYTYDWEPIIGTVTDVRYEDGKKIIEFDEETSWSFDIFSNSLTFTEGEFPIVVPTFRLHQYNELLCQFKDGEQTYHNPNYEECHYDEIISVEEIESNNLTITPTIFSSNETIYISSDSEIKDVKMIDMLGREINISINPTDDFTSQISLNQKCNSGIYLIIVETEKEVYYEKVVLR